MLYLTNILCYLIIYSEWSMARPHCEGSMAGPHCERLMAWPHEYILSPILPIDLFFLHQPRPHLAALPWACPSEFWPIVIFPHPPTQSVLSMTTDTASCAAPVSLSVRVLPDFSVSLAQLQLRWPPPRFLYLSWWGGCFFSWSPSCTSDSASLLYLSVLVGGVVVDTWSPSLTPD